MIIIILALIMLLMVAFVLKTRNMLSLWLLIAYLGCFLMVLGYMYYYAKSGGFSPEIQTFLFLNKGILRWLTYRPISMDEINNLIISGRSLFLFAILSFAYEAFSNRNIRESWSVYCLIGILPLISMTMYSSEIYRGFSVRYSTAVNAFTRVMIVAYTLLALSLLLVRYYRINIPWIKNQLMSIFLAVLSITLVFYLFGFFGSLQVADIFSIDYLYSGFGLSFSSDSIGYWYITSAMAMVFSIFGYISLRNYAKVEKQIGKPDLNLERKISTAHMGAKVFTHGIKNQLLISRVMIKRINTLLDAEELDREALKESLNKANEVNEHTLKRMDALYQTFIVNAMSLKPVAIEEVVKDAVMRAESFEIRYPIEIEPIDYQMILADRPHLSEALYNIIINGLDAIEAKEDSSGGQITIRCRQEGRHLMLMIEDNGTGIPEDRLNSIFDPFVTNKNTNYNWGIGLSQAQQIIDGHFGTIRIESTLDQGTIFFIDLPIYRMDSNKGPQVVE